MNKRTEALTAAVAATAEALEAAIPNAFTGDAHGLLMAVYKDPALPLPLRLDAAKAALRFEKPALSTIEAAVQQDVTARVESCPTIDVAKLSHDQRHALRGILEGALSGTGGERVGRRSRS